MRKQPVKTDCCQDSVSSPMTKKRNNFLNFSGTQGNANKNDEQADNAVQSNDFQNLQQMLRQIIEAQKE